MRFKTPTQPPLDHRTAEDIAAQAIAFLTSEPSRLTRFLSETGMLPNELAASLANGGTDMLSACLDHVVCDESLLLVFASEIRRKPEDVMMAPMNEG